MKIRTLNVTRTRLFYGWYIVGAGVLMNAVVSGVIGKGLTTLMTPIATTFGWSYAQVSLAMSLRGAEAGILGPFFGRAADRWPAKWLIVIGVTVMSLGFLCLSQTTNLAMYYVSLMIIALGSSLGHTMAPTATLARWFKRDIGKANGMIATGIGLGGFVVPVLVKLIDAFSWRTTMIIVAIAVWVICVPLAFLYRNRPEDYGMLPDGKKPDNTAQYHRAQSQDFSTGIREAIKKRAFWQLGFAEILQWAGIGAVSLHVVPYLSSVGMDRMAAGMIAMAFLIVSVPARFAFGWAADIFEKKYVAALSIALMAVGLFFFSLMRVDAFWLAISFIITYGVGHGGATPLRATLIREYFGAKNFGSIFGLEQLFMMVSSVATPPLVGWVYDTRGSYDPTWLILCLATAASSVLMITMPTPAGKGPVTNGDSTMLAGIQKPAR